MTLKLSVLASAIAFSTSQAATINISSLDQLGPASETITAIGELPTYNVRNVSGVTNVDIKDATFAALVDFNSGASTSNHILWETGGATIGASIAYQPSTGIITVSHSSNGGSGLDQLTHTLSGAQVDAGELEVAWAYNSTDIEFELFIDGISAGVTTEQTGTVSQND